MEQTVKLEFSVNEVNLLLAGLAELPLKHSGQLAGKLQKLTMDQIGEVKQLPETPAA